MLTRSYFCSFNYKTGEWAHSTRLNRFPERKWLSHFDVLNVASSTPPSVAASETVLDECMQSAEKELKELSSKRKSTDSNTSNLGEYSQLRWFVMSADEAAPQSELFVVCNV